LKRYRGTLTIFPMPGVVIARQARAEIDSPPCVDDWS
jgi:hypothetical protein